MSGRPLASRWMVIAFYFWSLLPQQWTGRSAGHKPETKVKIQQSTVTLTIRMYISLQCERYKSKTYHCHDESIANRDFIFESSSLSEDELTNSLAASSFTYFIQPVHEQGELVINKKKPSLRPTFCVFFLSANMFKRILRSWQLGFLATHIENH